MKKSDATSTNYQFGLASTAPVPRTCLSEPHAEMGRAETPPTLTAQTPQQIYADDVLMSSLPCTVAELEEFERLPTSAKYVQFQTQAYEIKQLRRKLRKYEKEEGKSVEADMINAEELVQTQPVELGDQGAIISNLLTALDTSALRPNTYPYDRICSLTRNAINMPTYHDKFVQLPEKRVAITGKEMEEYSKLPPSTDMYRVLLGETSSGVRVAENAEKAELEQYLLIQAEILKKMTYSQFVSSMKYARAQMYN